MMIVLMTIVASDGNIDDNADCDDSVYHDDGSDGDDG